MEPTRRTNLDRALRARRPGGVLKVLMGLLLLLLLVGAALASVGLTVFLKDLSETLPSSWDILRVSLSSGCWNTAGNHGSWQ